LLFLELAIQTLTYSSSVVDTPGVICNLMEREREGEGEGEGEGEREKEEEGGGGGGGGGGEGGGGGGRKEGRQSRSTWPGETTSSKGVS
jgi:hypothetical protein